MTPHLYPQFKRKRSLVLTGSMLTFLFVGLIYAWSIIVLPLEREFSWTRDKTSIVFTVNMIFSVLGSLLPGNLLKNFKPSVCLYFSAVLIFFGFIFSSRISSILEICITYGILCGLGIGIIINTVLTVTLLWFSEKPGFASGLLYGGCGLGTFILGPGVSMLLNSDFGWRRGFLIIGTIFTLIVLFESLILNIPVNTVKSISLKNSPKRFLTDMPPLGMLKSRMFRFFYLWGVVLGSCMMGILGIGALLVSDSGANPVTSAFVSGFLSVGNGGGRIFTGLVYDRFGRSLSMKGAALIFLLGLILLITVLLGGAGFLNIPGFVLAGIGCGTMPVIYSCTCKKYFGNRYFSVNIAIMNTYGIISVLFGSVAAGMVRSATGSYLPVLAGMCVLCTIAFLLEFCGLRE
jgi:OFA family oxalate/formate antiporter-like MFS transporter